MNQAKICTFYLYNVLMALSANIEKTLSENNF